MFFRFTKLSVVSCCCISFVSLILIAIKKISLKKSVQPINIPTISAQPTESIPASHRSRNDELQDTFELQAAQSHSGIINVAPVHMEEQSGESLENIDMNLPIENSEFNCIDVEIQESEVTSEAPVQIVCFPRLNNHKFNPNLISFAGLILLFVMIFILVILNWYIRFGNDFESFAFKTYMYYCSPIAFPTIYFIVNPKHLIKATILLFEGL